MAREGLDELIEIFKRGVSEGIPHTDCLYGARNVLVVLQPGQNGRYGQCLLAELAHRNTRFYEEVRDTLQELGCPQPGGLWRKGCKLTSGNYEKL